MAAPQLRLAGPAYVASSVTNVYTPPTSSQVTLAAFITVIWLVNTSNANQTVSVYVGATGGSSGGTQIIGGVVLAANSVTPYYYGDGLKMATTDFLTAICGNASEVTITVEGYVMAVA